MPYRRVDITLPADDETDVLGLCGDEIEVVDSVEVTGIDQRRAVSVLLDANEVEGLLEKLENKFDGAEKFRAIVVDVLAILPHPDDDDEDAADNEGGNQADEDEKFFKRAFGRIARDELLEDLRPGTQVELMYLSQVFLSSVIAAVGLVRNNPAVVIGAMVIAPLLIPNMSLALATTLGDLRMGARALAANAIGVALSLGFAVLVGMFIAFDPGVHEIASRTTVGYADVVLALAAGTAGAIAVTSGVSANLIGVMVAVALLPPMVAFGLLLGAGEFRLARGTGLLLAINITCVNLAAVGTFMARGIRPSKWYDKDRAKKATRISLAMWLLILAGTLFLIWWLDFELPTKP